MNDSASIQIASVSLSQSRKQSNEVPQSLPDVQVTDATCFGNRPLEISAANRAKVAQDLRTIAELLMSGALTLLLVVSTSIGFQSDEDDLILSEQDKAEEIL